MDNYGLVFENLNIKVNGFEIKELNFNQPMGTILGIVGRNGAGKTTLIKAISGLYNITRGEIFIKGLSRYEDEANYLKELGVVNDKGLFNEFHKPKTINKVLKKAIPSFDSDYFLKYLEYFGIVLNKRLSKMSLGEQKKVNIIAVLSLNPNILILDEPLANIDPISKVEITQMLQEFLTDDKMIIYSTNQTEELDKIADYLLFLEKGDVVLKGSKDQILENHYLVNISKSEFEQLKPHFISYKKHELGYQGLINQKELIKRAGLEYKIPSIEDLMYFYIKGERR